MNIGGAVVITIRMEESDRLLQRGITDAEIIDGTPIANCTASIGLDGRTGRLAPRPPRVSIEYGRSGEPRSTPAVNRIVVQVGRSSGGLRRPPQPRQVPIQGLQNYL